MQPNNNPGSQPARSFIEEARRAQIVDSAIEVIAEAGYNQASMARIAGHAGISRGLISYHFANKADLLTEVVTKVYLDGAQFMGPRIEAESTAGAQLSGYIAANLEYMRANPDRMAALIEIFTRASREELAGLDNLDADAALAPLESLFRAGQTTGEFGDFDVRTMAHAVRNVIDGVPAQMNAEGFDMDRCITEITTLFERATIPAADGKS